MDQKIMERSNTIGIVGTITDKPYLILNASEWRKRLYETKLERVRPSGAKDIFILRFDGSAAGTEKKIEEIVKGVEVMIGGEIRTENVYDPRPEENRVKVYIYAEMIAVNDPPVDDQNEVTIRGNICRPPYYRQTRSRTVKGKRRTVTNLIVAVNSNKGANYIPCVCFGWQAFLANALEVGDYVLCGILVYIVKYNPLSFAPFHRILQIFSLPACVQDKNCAILLKPLTVFNCFWYRLYNFGETRSG